MDAIIKSVKLQLRNGSTLTDALKGVGISYTKWRALCVENGVKITAPKGRKPTVYTPERIKELKKRIRNGEFLRNAARDMGMDPRNAARYCRINGIKLFSKTALKANYAMRDYSNVGRWGGHTPKTRLVLEKIQAGMANEDIARELGVPLRTVDHQRKKLEKSAETSRA